MVGTVFNTSNWTGYDEQSVTNPSAALTDFTLLIDISTLSATWKTEVQSDGADIRVTKGDNTELPFDLINFASTPTGIIRVKFSGTLAASGTQNIRVWVGYTLGTAIAYDATETFGSDNAYDANWLSYLPLDGDGLDRTSNGNDGTLFSLAFPGQEITGQVGSGLDLDGSSDYINLGSGIFGALTGFTAMAWVKAASQASGAEDTILGNWKTSASDRSVLFRYDSNSNQLDFFVHPDTGGAVGASNSVTIEGAFHHVAAVYDGTAGTGTTYADGSALANVSSLGGSNTLASAQSLRWGDTPHVSSDRWLGGLDELQFHDAARPPAWVSLERQQSNSQSTFWGTWAFTSVGGGGDPIAPLAVHHMNQMRGI